MSYGAAFNKTLSVIAIDLRTLAETMRARHTLDRNDETKERTYHSQTIRGPMREAQAYLTRPAI